MYNSNDEVKEDEMGRACSTHGEKMNTYRILMGRSEGKRPLGYFLSCWTTGGFSRRTQFHEVR
jgi:hypothetical protein